LKNEKDQGNILYLTNLLQLLHSMQALFTTIALTALLLFANKNAFAQLEISYQEDTDALVKEQFLAKNAGIEVLAVRYAGSEAAIGTFTSNMVYSNFLGKGIILSTGNIMDAKGPNLVNNKSGKNMQSGFSVLSTLAKSTQTFDAAVLAFDFRSKGDSISFRYFFASEEYPEFVNRNVNDVFAFFLIDLENGESKNLAVLPHNGSKICVDEINLQKNSEYFRLNGKWEPDNTNKWKNDLEKGELALYFEFDGFTTILQAGAKIVPQHRYRLIMAITDVGDDMYDSAIFLEANSFGNGDENPLQDIFSNLKYEAENNALIGEKNIVFNFGSAEITDAKSLVLVLLWQSGSHNYFHSVLCSEMSN